MENRSDGNGPHEAPASPNFIRKPTRAESRCRVKVPDRLSDAAPAGAETSFHDDGFASLDSELDAPDVSPDAVEQRVQQLDFFQRKRFCAMLEPLVEGEHFF